MRRFDVDPHEWLRRETLPELPSRGSAMGSATGHPERRKAPTESMASSFRMHGDLFARPYHVNRTGFKHPDDPANKRKLLLPASSYTDHFCRTSALPTLSQPAPLPSAPLSTMSKSKPPAAVSDAASTAEALKRRHRGSWNPQRDAAKRADPFRYSSAYSLQYSTKQLSSGVPRSFHAGIASEHTKKMHRSMTMYPMEQRIWKV